MQGSTVQLLLLSVLAVSAAKTVYVSQGGAAPNTTTFYQAVIDPQVSNIVLTSNYTLGDEFSLYKTVAFQLSRNLTVSALHGTDDVLDLQYKRAKVELCADCVWKWTNITVANERRGAGPGWDFFVGSTVGQPLVISENVVRWRWACAASKYTREIIPKNKRPPNVPKDAAQMQEYAILPVKYHGNMYSDTLVLYDHGAMIPRTMQEGLGVTGGYGLWDHNVTRICYYVVGEDCLQVRSPEACVNDKIDEALAGGPTPGPARGGLSTSYLAAAITVPILAAAASVAVAAVVIRHRQKKKQLRQQQSMLAGRQYLDVPHANGDGQKWQNHDSPQPGSQQTGSSAKSHRSGPLAIPHGWGSTSSLTNPLAGPVEDSKITFGDLLGAGSFGRVYRGTWGGKTVAIKVIEYDTTTRDAVQNEVQLILSFNHPNIVRAYHCVTYTRAGATTSNGRHSSDRPTQGGINHTVTGVGPVAQNPCDLGHVDPSKQQAGHTGRQLDSAQRQSPLQQQADAGEVAVRALRDQEARTIGGTGPEDRASPQECWTIAERAKNNMRMGQTLSTIKVSDRVETWLVQEYCDLGTLGTFCSRLRESNTANGMTTLLMLLLDVANGLKALHGRSTVHGDLNSRNVLVTSNPQAPNGCTAKLADLGLARVMAQTRTHRTTDTVGTISHMPPELLRYGKRSPAGDIYAFGITMWEVFTGAQAFKDLHYGQFFEEIVLNDNRPPLPHGMPSYYLMLMEHCWAADPADRPTIDRLVQCIESMVDWHRSASSRRSSAVLTDTPQNGSTAGTSTS